MALTDVTAVGAMLRWQQGEDVDHVETLQDYVDAVSAYLQKPERYGPLEATVGTSVSDGAGSISIPLFPNRPFAITSVTVDGTPVTDYTHDRGAGILYGSFSRGRSNVTVSYTVGFEVVPADVKLAATKMCAHNWNVWSQRGSGYSEGLYPIGFSEPAAVTEDLSAYKSMIGFA